MPVYLRQLGWIQMNPGWDGYFNTASKFMLFAAGGTGTLIILYNVIRAYRQRRHIEHRLRKIQEAPASSTVCLEVPKANKIEKAAVN